MLPGIVKERRVRIVGGNHDLSEWHALEFRTLEKIVPVRDVRLMVLAVMKLQRLRRHKGSKRIVSIRKFRKFQRHM